MLSFRQFIELANGVSTVSDKVPSGDRRPDLLSGGEADEPGPMKRSNVTSAFPVNTAKMKAKLKSN